MLHNITQTKNISYNCIVNIKGNIHQFNIFVCAPISIIIGHQAAWECESLAKRKCHTGLLFFSSIMLFFPSFMSFISSSTSFFHFISHYFNSLCYKLIYFFTYFCLIFIHFLCNFYLNLIFLVLFSFEIFS